MSYGKLLSACQVKSDMLKDRISSDSYYAERTNPDYYDQPLSGHLYYTQSQFFDLSGATHELDQSKEETKTLHAQRKVLKETHRNNCQFYPKHEYLSPPRTKKPVVSAKNRTRQSSQKEYFPSLPSMQDAK